MAQKIVHGAGRSVHGLLLSYRCMSQHGQTGRGRDLFVYFNMQGVPDPGFVYYSRPLNRTTAVKASHSCPSRRLHQYCEVWQNFREASREFVSKGPSHPVYVLIPIRTCKKKFPRSVHTTFGVSGNLDASLIPKALVFFFLLRLF